MLKSYKINYKSTKTYGDLILSSEKRYFNYQLSRACMVNEGALGKLKSQFRVLHRTSKSNKETMKVMCLAFVILNNICTEREDMIPMNVNLTGINSTYVTYLT